MPRQQEIRNPLLNRILMPAAPTHQFPLLDACLQQHAVQVLGRLAGHQLRLRRGTGSGLGALDEVGGCGGGRGEVGEAELLFMLVNMHLLDHVVLWESCRRAWNSSLDILDIEENVERAETYLFADCAELLPHQAGQDVAQKRQVHVCLEDLELRVLGVQGKAGSLGLARFDRAGEEVEREELHCGGSFFGLGMRRACWLSWGQVGAICGVLVLWVAAQVRWDVSRLSR